MTVTKEATLLYLFEAKVGEAVSYVPRMCPEEKLKAVQFWNIVSEKLQDIVNNSAADINAVAFKMGETESEKIEASNSDQSISHSSISSEFLTLPPHYEIGTGAVEQYHTIDIKNAQLLASQSFSSVTEQSLNSSVSNIQHMNQLHNSMSVTEKNITHHYITKENLPDSNCDTIVENSSSVSVMSNDSVQCIKNSDCATKEILTQESRTKVKTSDCNSKEMPVEGTQTYLSLENAESDPDDPLPVNSIPLTSNNSPIKKSIKMSMKSNKFSFTKHLVPSEENDSSNSKPEYDKRKNAICDVSESSKDSNSGNKSDFETVSHTESDSNHVEPVVSFVVSRTEEILTNNETGLNTELSHNSSVFSCKHCPKKFPDESELAVHSWVHNNKPYSCSDCLAQFSTKGNLLVHMRKHTGEKPFSCSKCSSRFTTKGNLKRHLKTHTGEKPFKCDHCEGRFTEKKSLIVHMRRHTGEKPYSCKVCGKSFSQAGVLQSHMDMHLNQKAHLCEKCGKSFRQKSQLHIHKLRHENVKKYGCTSCDASFLTKGDLERHIRTHTGERPYLCEICSKTFTRQQSLNEHMNRHLGVRPYACKYCDKAFAEMSACYKHIKLHEKEQSKQNQEPINQDIISEPVNEDVVSEPVNHDIASEAIKDNPIFQEQIPSGTTTYKLVKLGKIGSLKSQAVEMPQKQQSSKTDSHETLVSFIENFL